MSRFLFISTILVFYSLSASSLEIGRQPIRNFSHREYLGHIQNWGLAQDSRGLIYVANNYGVLEFDGSNWRTISINNAVTRSLVADSEGRIWVGAQDELGYLAPDSTGKLTFYSLKHLISDSSVPIGLVRQVYSTPTGIYFSANNSIVRIKGQEVKTILPSTFFHRTYYALGYIFSIQPGLGLTVVKGDTLVLAPAGEKLAHTRIYAMIPFDDEQILIATQSDGFFLYNVTSLNDEQASIKPFYTSNDKFFKENWVYHGINLKNGWFAISTYRGGAVIINRDGQIIQYIGKSQGIQDETVWHLAADRHDNIWLALNNGISYSAIKSPITSWDADHGLQGVLQSVKRYKDWLYVSTNAGVFTLKGDYFDKVKGIIDLSWDIEQVNTSDGKEFLLVGSGNGVYILQDGFGKIIENGNIPTFHIYQSKNHPDIVYLGLYDGIGVAAYSNGRWRYLGRFDNVAGRIFGVVEDKSQSLWFVERHKSVVRAKISNPHTLIFDSKEIFSEIPHNPPFDEDTRLVNINGEIKISSPKGLSFYDAQSNSFKPDSSLGKEFTTGEKGIKVFKHDAFGNLWYEIYTQPHTRSIKRSKVNADGSVIILPAELNEIPKMIFYSVDTDADGISWLAGADGLYRFDPMANSRGIVIPKALIRNVSFGSSKYSFGGAYAKECLDDHYICIGEFQDNNSIQRIPYKDNTVTFHFSSPLFGQEDRMLFSYMLEGFDSDWISWNTIRHKEYTNLPYGKYTFKVKTMSVFDIESPVASYAFEIIRPWYNHPMMFFFYFVLIGLIVFISVVAKTRMLKASNLKLQAMVSERTREILDQQRDILMKNEELLQQKEEIASQRDELETKSRLTHSSLHYALKIQQAILPRKSFLDEHFENFVFFKPKDVVSGDFYWLSHLFNSKGSSPKIFIAVVDCTGHGVPGAFMSMIGSRMLSEIINERRIQDPAAILSELNIMLVHVLQQESNDNFDGMDVALCSFDQISKGRYLISFAGANRSLSYYRKGASDLTVVKGNRKTIGGILPDIDPIFENHLIDLISGDTLFLQTDGYVDQNNDFGKKFSTLRLNTILLSNINEPMDQIGKTIEKNFEAYKGSNPQRDDVTVIGLRLK